MPFSCLEISRRRNRLAVLATLLSLPALQAVAGDQAADVVARATSGPLRCEIRRDAASSAVGLTGVVGGSRRIAGDFRFVVTKSGSAGSSNIDQGDRFDVDADKEGIVGHVQIGLERDARVIVDLSVRSDDGLECRAKAQLGQ